MQKHLVNSEDEFLALFKDWHFSDVEKFLNIEFAFEDGTFHSDMEWVDDAPSINEDQLVSLSIHRKNDGDGHFPEEYPCVVLLENVNDWDRCGDFKIQILYFVYLKDFYPNA